MSSPTFLSNPSILRLFGAHEAANQNEIAAHERANTMEMMNTDAFADIEGESPQQRLSPKMNFAKGVHEKTRNKGDVFGGKRRSKSHRKSHRKAHRKASRKASRKACRKASRKAHRKSCRCGH